MMNLHLFSPSISRGANSNSDRIPPQVMPRVGEVKLTASHNRGSRGTPRARRFEAVVFCSQSAVHCSIECADAGL
jgi:hypothetical protein